MSQSSRRTHSEDRPAKRKRSDFKRYTPDRFREADQMELGRVIRELDAKGS
jgi:hypothetical protein